MKITHYFALLVCLLVVPQAWSAQTLRYSAVSSWNMPYARFDGEQVVEGIMYDLAMAVEAQLQIPVTFVVFSRKRVDAAATNGDVDLRCYITPQWTELPEQYVWSGKLFEVSDVIFGTDATAAPASIDEIPFGSVISTVLGYGYPTLDTSFASGRLKREDAVDQEKVNLKLTAARTPYGVSEVVALNWYERLTPNHRHAPWRLVVSKQDFQCGIPKKGNIPAAKILKAFDAMKKANQFEDILRKYR